MIQFAKIFAPKRYHSGDAQEKDRAIYKSTILIYELRQIKWHRRLQLISAEDD